MLLPFLAPFESELDHESVTEDCKDVRCNVVGKKNVRSYQYVILSVPKSPRENYTD
jgi:hypothetical protein